MDKKYHKEVAETIAKQMGGTGRLVAMIGANSFAFDGPSLQFRFKAGRKFNFCRVDYNEGLDLYNVKISRVTCGKLGFRETNVKMAEDMYCDQLVGFFEQTTGLYLSI